MIGYCDEGYFYGLISMGSLLNATAVVQIAPLQLSVINIDEHGGFLVQINMLGASVSTFALARLSLVDFSDREFTLLHLSAYSGGGDAYSLIRIAAINSTSEHTVISAFQFSLLNTAGFHSLGKAWHPLTEEWLANKKDNYGFRGFAQVGAMNFSYTFKGFTQVGTIFSYTGSFLGLMQTGLINSAGYGSLGDSLIMTQEEELPNETITDEKTGEVTELGQAREGFRGGFQVGVWNTATKFAGIGQFGVLNMVQTMKGLQTGVVNVARTVYGAQIGLVNYTGDLYGFQIGLVNIVKNNKVFFMPILMASF